jgi:lysine/ornithine N-monooxygenase
MYSLEDQYPYLDAVGPAYQDDSQFDLAIIGGGPKGLALHIAALKRGLRSVVLDTRPRDETTWQNSDPLRLMHPPQLELTDSDRFSYQGFIRNDPDGRRSQYGPLTDGIYSKALHFHSYLQWLGEQLPNVVHSCPVEHIKQSQSGMITINHILRARSVAIATGMRGHGGQEFMRDPSGLLGNSERVTHSPGFIETDTDFAKFIEGQSSIGIVGSSASAIAALERLDLLAYNKAVHVITEEKEAEQRLLSELARRNQSRRFYDRIELANLSFHSGHRVVRASEHPDHLDLVTSKGSFQLGACILATGFEYDIRELPFMRGSQFHENLELDEDPRYPRLNSRFEIQRRNGQKSNVFALGESAKRQDPSQSWLSTTAKTVNTIVEEIAGRVISNFEFEVEVAAT